MTEKTYSLSTGAVYRYSANARERLDHTLAIVESKKLIEEFGPLGIELMLVYAGPDEMIKLLEDNLGLRKRIDAIHDMGGIMTIHADRPLLTLDHPSRIPDDTLNDLARLTKLVHAQYIVWHAGWGMLNEVVGNGLPIALENEDPKSGGAKSARELSEIMSRHPEAKFVIDLAHLHAQPNTSPAKELKEIHAHLGSKVVGYHLSALRYGHEHITLVEAGENAPTKLHSLLPRNSHCVIESTIPGRNPVTEMYKELLIIENA